MDRTLDPASLLSLGASYTAPSLGGLDVTPTVTPRTAHSPSRVTPSLGSCAVCASCASRCTAFAPVSLPRPFNFAHCNFKDHELLTPHGPTIHIVCFALKQRVHELEKSDHQYTITALISVFQAPKPLPTAALQSPPRPTAAHTPLRKSLLRSDQCSPSR